MSTTGRPKDFAHYDRRRYRTVGVVEGYSTWAPVYGDLDDRFDVELLESSAWLAARVPDACVVDLGCGTGRIGAWARRRGARQVWGVDLTRGMLAHAARREVYASLARGDVTRLPLASESFDGATTSLAVCHVADLDAFFRESARVLRPGGWLAFVDYHPVFLFAGIPTHFDDPSTGESISIANHIHPASALFAAADAAGLSVRDVRERFIDDAWLAVSPNYRKFDGLPITHLWAFEKR